MCLNYNDNNSCLFANGKEIIKYKADNKNFNFLSWFCWRNIAHILSATESREISLNGNVYDLSIGYNSVDKYEILNIQKYLTTKNK